MGGGAGGPPPAPPHPPATPPTHPPTQIACVTAGPDCTSLFYDPLSQSCFLKHDESPYAQAPPITVACEGRRFLPGSAAEPEAFNYPCSRGVTHYRRGAPVPEGCAADAPA